MSIQMKTKRSSKTYVVTGAAGFIGDNLARSLASQGHEVIWVDALAHFQSRTQEHPLSKKAEKIDRDHFAKWLRSEAQNKKIDGIFHLGACTDTTELNVEYLRKINIEYSKDLWKLCSERKIPFVYASSAATYGGGELSYDDDESKMALLKPLNPYGESKLIFDLWALDEEKKGIHPPSWAGFKFFNVYGFGERHKGKMSSVIIQAFDQIQSKGSMKLFRSHKDGIADGEQKRDFIFVEDVVSVLKFAMEKPITRGIYNLGTGQARTFLDLARATFAALKKPEKIEFMDTPVGLRERYQYFTEARMQKLRSAGYSAPFASLEAGIEKYVERLLSES